MLIAIKTSSIFAMSEQPGNAEWRGRANRLDAHPMYSRPAVDEVSRASEGRASGDAAPGEKAPPRRPAPAVRAAEVILGRRGAQRFDAKFTMDLNPFVSLLKSLADGRAPIDVWRFQPRLHPMLFVHRVEGPDPGPCALPRHASAVEAPRTQMRDDFESRTPEGFPSQIPLQLLMKTDCRCVARNLNCRRTIACDAGFARTLIAGFETLVAANPWRYRQLHWEAGLIGQAFYLGAEAAGLSGTGIGCFFDDDIHATHGLNRDRFQALDGFTVGRPLIDEWIMTLPA